MDIEKCRNCLDSCRELFSMAGTEAYPYQPCINSLPCEFCHTRDCGECVDNKIRIWEQRVRLN